MTVFHLRYRQSGGTTTEPAGYECQMCKTYVDMGYLIRQLDLRRKRAELSALETEIAQEDATAVPPRKEPARASA